MLALHVYQLVLPQIALTRPFIRPEFPLLVSADSLFYLP